MSDEPTSEGPTADDAILVVAGEASGDLHAARLIEALRTRLPESRFWGLGSDEMAEAGCELVSDSREIAVVGISEVARILPRAWEVFQKLLAEVERRGTRVAILLDFPDFNLRLAKQLERRGVRVIYYISPQVWAWRRGRVKTIARTVERMLVLFPFEVDFYREHGVDVTHVGHPLVDEVPERQQVWDGEPPGTLPEEAVLALLPGSRRSEVRALLPTMLQTAARLAAERPLRVRLVQARSVPEELFDTLLREGPEFDVERVRDDRFSAYASAHLALCASGTATLEVGLLTTPMIVVYRLSRFSYLLGRLLVRLPHYSLVNLVLGTGAVPERIQGESEPEILAATARDLLGDRGAIDHMRQALGELRARLGRGGASERAAEAVVDLLQGDAA